MTARERIEKLTDERAARRRLGVPVEPIEKQLEEAWVAVRKEEAAARSGAADVIIARARVEREIERLMGASDEPAVD